MPQFNCEVCNISFDSDRKRPRFCSNKCRFSSKGYISSIKECIKCGCEYTGRHNSKICDKCKTKLCKNCGTEFVNVRSHYCSRECLINSPITIKGSIKTGTQKLCLNCQNEFYVTNCERNRKFCSEYCSSKYRTMIIKHNKIPCNNMSCNNILFKSDTDLKNSLNKIFYCCVRCLNIGRSQKAAETRKYTNTKPELKFAEKLKEYNIDYCIQYWIEWKRGWKKFYDFYLPNIDTLIEIDGTYWHGKNLNDDQLNETQTHTRNNDKIKNELALSQNYKLIRIWADEIDNFDFNILI